jgi:hypothetical protein
MDQFFTDLLKQSPSTGICLISVVLFLKAMKERDTIFLATLQQFHKEVRDDKERADDRASLIVERNITALAKNSERLDVNTDALNEIKNFMHRSNSSNK